MTTVASKPKAATRPATVGALIDQMWALREKKRVLEADAEEISKQMSALEVELTERMDKEGVAKSTGSKASVSFTTSIIADPQGDEGWAKFHAFIAKKKYWHLLQKRVSEPAYREVLASLNGGGDVDLMKVKNQVPGVLPFVKKRISLRALST